MYKLLNRQGFFSLFCWMLIICSCQSTERNLSIPAIEADITSDAELKLSEYFVNFRMLKLPTDTVMGKINRIRYENNRIYISNEQTLFVFSDDGKLLSCFKKRGKGPGEYSGITDFMVDDENIIILDRNQQRLQTYDHSGESISTYNLGYFAQAISPAVNHSFFLYFGNEHSHKLCKVRNGREDSMFLEIDKDRAKYLHIDADHNFYQYQKFVYFYQPFSDIVYESIEGGSIKPSFYINYKGKNIPASFFKKKYAHVGDFFENLHKTSYAYGVSNFALYDRYLMFNSFYQKNEKLTIFDRKNKISNTFATITDDVYFNGLPITVSEFVYHANSHIFVPLDASDVFEWKNAHPPTEQFKEMINATKEEDNPLLLIFDFKK